MYRSIDAERFHKIKDKKKRKKLEAVHKILFELGLSSQVSDQIRLIKPICTLILVAQKKKYTLGEFVKEWLQLPSKYEDFESNDKLRKAITNRSKFVLTDMALAAYCFLPTTNFNSLDLPEQRTIDW